MTFAEELLELCRKHIVTVRSNCHNIMGVEVEHGFDKEFQKEWITNLIDCSPEYEE